ncbi:MAG: cupredoxin domain-containing protein [Stellaceae bacterium]
MIDKGSGWRSRVAISGGILSVGLLLSAAAGGDDLPAISITIKDHHFAPSDIHVPQGKPVTLKITNTDATPEEFDSPALKVEKVIVGGTYGIIRLRPLGRGRYPFSGEYHPDTARGVVISE